MEGIKLLPIFAIIFTIFFFSGIAEASPITVNQTTTNNVRGLYISQLSNGTLVIGDVGTGIWKSEDTGITWVHVVKPDITPKKYFLNDDNLYYLKDKSSNIYFGWFNFTNDTNEGGLLIGKSTVLTSFSMFQKRNGNFSILAGGTQNLTLYDVNTTTAIGHEILDNSTSDNGFDATEISNGYIYISKAKEIVASGSNWNVTNVSTSYVQATDNLLINKKNLSQPIIISDISGNVYTVINQRLSNGHVIWFSSMNSTKAFTTPTVIVNSTTLIEAPQLSIDTATGYLFLMYNTNPAQYCYIIYSSNHGNSWSNPYILSSNQCSRGAMNGQFAWLSGNFALNSTNSKILQTAYFKVNANVDIIYNNVSIDLATIQIITGKIIGTDVIQTWFDFETGSVGSSNFSAGFTNTDFRYHLLDNILYQYVPASPYNTEFNADNTLLNVDCRQATSWRTNPLDYGINIPYGTYDIICFNLSAWHNGLDTYGAIKVINNTNVRGGDYPEFDFWYAYYPPQNSTNPTDVQFSNIQYSPNPAQENINITITWLTSYPMTTYAYVSVVNNGTQTPYFIVNQSDNTSITHSLTINNIYSLPPYIVVFLSGKNAYGTEFNATPINIIIGYNATGTVINDNSTLGNATTNTGIFKDQTTGIYIFGIILLFMATAISFFFGGFKFGMTGFVSLLVIETIIGFLPIFLVIPIIVLVAGAIAYIFRKILLGGGN